MLEIHKGFVNDFLYVPLTVGYVKSRNSLFFFTAIFDSQNFAKLYIKINFVYNRT